MSKINKYLYMLLSALLIIPSVFYLINNKTILGFDNFLNLEFKPDYIPISGLTYSIIYALIILCLGIISIFMAINNEKYFKKVEDIFKFTLIASLLFVFIIPLTSQDIFYYFGNSRLFEHFNINPYNSTIKEIITNQPDLLNDSIMNQTSINCWIEYDCPYPPAWLIITSIFTFLSFGSIDICLLITKLFFVAAHLLCALLIYKIFNNKKFLILYALNPVMLLNNIVELHNDLFVFLFILLSLYFLLNKKNILLSIIFISLAIATKYIAVLILPFIIIYHFRNLNPSKRFVKCLLYGMLSAILILLTMVPFLDLKGIINIFTNQQTFFANNFYIIIYMLTKNDILVKLLAKIFLAVFTTGYISFYIYFLFKKEISRDYLIKSLLIITSIFVFTIITNFRCWYILWIFPFCEKYAAKFSQLSIITYVLLLITKDVNPIFSFSYYPVILIIIMINYYLKRRSIKNDRKRILL